MTDQIPAPGPSGYQPSPGEGITEIAFEIFPSWGYQKVGVHGTYRFPEPRSYSEALPAIDELYAALEEDAARRVDSLVALKDEREAPRNKAASAPAAGPAPAPQPAPSQAAPAQAPHPAEQDQQIQQQLGGQVIGENGMVWAVGQKPQQRGSFKYLTTGSVSQDQFRALAQSALTAVEVNPQDVLIFDDRTGKYGLESGNTSYSAGKAKAKDGSTLKQLLGQRDTVAYLDFGQDGSVSAHITKDAKTALQAIKLQQSMGQQAPQPPAADEPPF